MSNAPKRPGQFDDAISEQAARAILPDVIKWVRVGNGNDNEDEVLSDLIEALDFVGDGFEIASNLKSSGWECDSELVAILDEVQWARSEAHEKAVAEWSAANNIKPQFKIGDRVHISARRLMGLVVGEIINIDEAQALYHIFCEPLGHVREGNGTHAILLEYEDVTAVDAVEAANE